MKKITKILLTLVLALGMVISPLQGMGSISASAADENPMRALWLRPKQTSKSQVETVVQKVYNAGINTIFLETVFNGYTIFPVTYDGTYLNPDYNGFDVLQAYVDACHSRGMQLHCWVESFFIGMVDVDAGGPVYKTYKDKGWLLTDKDGVNYEDTKYGPMYFLNPARPECRDWIVNLYAKFVEKYDVDGIQLDYVRYPQKTASKDYGYDDYTINAFIQAGGSDPTNAKDGSAVATAFVKFKQDQVTKFVKQCSDTLRAIKPDLIISLSVVPNFSEGKSSYMQSAGLWMEEGYGDLIVPMAYTESQVTSVTQSTISLVGGNEQNVVIGLSTQNNYSASSIKNQTNTVLNKGAGVAYFEYESFFGGYPSYINYSTTLKSGPLKNTQFNIDPAVYKSYVGNGGATETIPANVKGYLTRANCYDYDDGSKKDILVFASEDSSASALSILGEEKETFGWFCNFVLEYNSAKGKWIVTKADFSNDGTNQYQTEKLGQNKMYVMFHGDAATNQADSVSFFLNTVSVGQEYWLVGDWDAIADNMGGISGVYLTTTNPNGSTGGNTGGSTGGNTGGSTSGSTGGNTGGNTGGTTGGTTGGNTGGTTDGTTGGTTGGNTGGTTDGTTDGTTGGTTDGTEDGITDGTEDGTEVGTEDGITDGTEGGTTDGTEDGTTDGTEDGTTDGTEDGTEGGTANDTTKDDTDDGSVTSLGAMAVYIVLAAAAMVVVVAIILIFIILKKKQKNNE